MNLGGFGVGKIQRQLDEASYRFKTWCDKLDHEAHVLERLQVLVQVRVAISKHAQVIPEAVSEDGLLVLESSTLQRGPERLVHCLRISWRIAMSVGSCPEL